MASMGNLFDIAILLAVGMLIMALSSFGLGDLLTKNNVTIAVNPGQKDMQIVTRQAGQITKLTPSGSNASGVGQFVGGIYRLQNGQFVYVQGQGPAK